MKNGKAGFTLPELLVVIFIIAFSLSICAALGPSMNRARESANIALCANNLRQIGTAMAMYTDCYGGLLPWYENSYDPSFKKPYNCEIDPDDPLNCPQDPFIGHPYVAFRMDKVDEAGNLRPMLLGCLYAAGVVEDARIFYCPSETEPQYQYDSYTNPLNPQDSNEWGTLPQLVNVNTNQWVRTGYCYYPANIIDDPESMAFRGNYIAINIPRYTPRTLNRMDPAIPYLTDFIWKRVSPTQEELQERGGRPKPLAHRMGRIYSLNALFKDNHTIYYKNQDIFRSNLWWRMEENSMIYPDWREFYYGIYRAIGKVGNPLHVAPYFQSQP